jgi:hypothetical protein
MISPKVFAEKMWEGASDRIIELAEEIQKSLEAEGNTELEAIEGAARMMPRVKAVLRQKIQYCEEKKVTPNFRFSGTSDDRLIGMLISEKDVEVRLRLRHRKELQRLINSLAWEKFENLCFYTLETLGFKTAIGRRRQDGGLDFFGLWPLQNQLRYKGFLTDMNLRVFGQAKHRRRSAVNGDEVRSFLSHFEDFRNERGIAYEFIRGKHKWFLDGSGPLTPMVMTNTRFERDAEEWARLKGIVLREGSQIVEDVVRLAEPTAWLVKEHMEYCFVPGKFESYLDAVGSRANVE